MKYLSIFIGILLLYSCCDEQFSPGANQGDQLPLIEETIADLLPLVGEGDSIELTTRMEAGKSIILVEIPVDEGNRDGQINRMLGVLDNKNQIELREREEENGNSVFVMEVASRSTP